MAEILKQGKYRHYKGGMYEVIGVARHSETGENLVVYRTLYETQEFPKYALAARPLEMFTDKVEVKGKKVPRFQYIAKLSFKLKIADRD